jgi:hypothetical protein
MRPLSVAQSRVHRTVLVALGAIGIVLGGWEARDCAATQFGYAAGYAYAGAVFLAIALLVIGALLTIYWRTRPIGLGFVAAGVLSCVTFYGGMAILLRLDRVAWKHEPPPVAIGPSQNADLVIYFRNGTSDKQIEEFRSSILQEPGWRYQTYLRLLPNQANGHDAVALTFSRANRPPDLARYIEKIRRDGRVETVYENVAPTEIQRPRDTATSALPK